MTKERKRSHCRTFRRGALQKHAYRGADANASVTGNESTVPMQLRITGRVEMPNSKTYDLTGCFVGLEAWGDVSSERAIVRTRNISCIKGDKTIDQPINGHVSFMGKNGVKGEVVMRNGKILGWAWGGRFLLTGLAGHGTRFTAGSWPGATASVGAGDVLKMGVGGGASKAAQTLSEYYIKGLSSITRSFRLVPVTK